MLVSPVYVFKQGNAAAIVGLGNVRSIQYCVAVAYYGSIQCRLWRRQGIGISWADTTHAEWLTGYLGSRLPWGLAVIISVSTKNAVLVNLVVPCAIIAAFFVVRSVTSTS